MSITLKTVPLAKGGTYLFNTNGNTNSNLSFIAGSSNPFAYEFKSSVHIGGDLTVGGDSSNSIACTGDLIAYNSSDKTLKENIEVIKRPLEKIKTIGGYSFKWTDNAPNKKGGQTDQGVIAQEIRKIIPEAIREDKEGLLSVQYIKIIPLLVECIKELNVKIEKLENGVK